MLFIVANHDHRFEGADMSPKQLVQEWVRRFNVFFRRHGIAVPESYLGA